MALVPASLFTSIINRFGEPVTVSTDSYYEDEAGGWTGSAMWEVRDADNWNGAPEVEYVLTVPANAHMIAEGMKLTVSGKDTTYTVVEVRPELILTSEPMQFYVGVRGA